jgi:hypothetical protein
MCYTVSATLNLKALKFLTLEQLMNLSLVVMVVHFCAISNVSPFLTDCTARAFPIKGETVEKAMKACEVEKADWDADKAYKRYFNLEERPLIKHRELAIVAPIHCELQPEHEWKSRSHKTPATPVTNPVDGQRDLKKEMDDVSNKI